MEQQHRSDNQNDGKEDPIGPDVPPRRSAGEATPESGGADQKDGLAIEDFALDDIEEIESKVFA